MFRRSALVDWSGFIAVPGEQGGGGKRGLVGSMSDQATRRLTFALANSPKDWGVMVTLTFRDLVIDGRKPLRRFQRLLRKAGLGELHHAWVREYQTRGAVHYHYLLEREALQERGWLNPQHLEPVQRKNAVRSLVRGPLERLLVDAWCQAVGDESEEFQAFQNGGIVELMGEGDSASRYFGSYLGKKEQKTLPPGAEKCGRWWYVCSQAKPIEQEPGTVAAWPFPKPYGCVFDKQKLLPHFSAVEPEPLGKGWEIMEQIDRLNPDV